MTQEQERRNPKTERVKVATLVEVCGNIPGIPVFEAESINVSPQGMHLRTAYLPDTGAPLVCRFESDGREIVVEGMVAWRKESGRGGEFGVKFTALDSRSVDALRTLCGLDAADEPKSDSSIGEPGARVRLHIEGLGSPMKARVKTGSAAKLQVGSSLEFLKVGKRLELEDLDVGGRRAAEIDTVSVVVDPSTRVPQLVVGLRFEGAEENTPSPSVSHVGPRETATGGVRIPTQQVSTDAPRASKTKAAEPAIERKASNEAPSPDAPEAETEDDEPEMRGRVAAMAANAEQRAKAASEKLSRGGLKAARGAAQWMKGATARLLSREEPAAPRRTTSPVPTSLSADKPKLRQQSSASASSMASEPTPNSTRKRNLALAGGATLIAIGAVAMAMRGPSAPPPGEKLADASSELNAPNVAAAALPGPQTAAAKGANPAPLPGSPVVANVPLFGPTPLTTTEPAPLGPPPGSDAADIEASERAEAKASAAPRAMDEAFPETEEEGPSHEKKGDKSAKSDVKPEDVSPWGHGKMHEPTIHRLRLDAAGAKIAGNMEPTGFTVVIPERKVMETGAAIAKRDPRIARVRTNNVAGGAQISFRFKDGVPSYRVRLRRDYVEFLISETPKDAKPELKALAKDPPASSTKKKSER